MAGSEDSVADRLRFGKFGRLLRDMVPDAILFGVAYLAAYCLVLRSTPLQTLAPLALVGVLVGPCILIFRGLYNVNIRYLGVLDFINIGLSSVAVSVIMCLTQVVLAGMPVFESVVSTLLFSYFAVTLLCGTRIARRSLAWRGYFGSTNHSNARRTLIVGAGDAGEAIYREIARAASPKYLVVGFVDDDPRKAGQTIHRIRVLGTSKDIPRLVTKFDIDEILLAVPSATQKDMRNIIDECNKTRARVRSLPALTKALAGNAKLSNYLIPINVNELLRREHVESDVQATASYTNGNRVLITGSGGSIGGELARQVARLNPTELILLGRGENSIYEIEQELLQTSGLVPTTVIADVRDRGAMERVFEKYKPNVVFHAAAHKHVPLMQQHPIEAFCNNVIGTMNVAEMSVRHAVTNFILISTDKAVNPSNIMGATKRICEFIICSLAEQSETNFSIVRFGNVLGSRGSLVPALEAQIKRGGPIRITHPDMTRYFMTIPEAVQLIVQAGAIGKRGEIFILDMGQPVKIMEIAAELIRMHNLVLDVDITIQFTGIRPGEKIHEELVYDKEELAPTIHPKIRMVANQNTFEWTSLRKQIHDIKAKCDSDDIESVRRSIMELSWTGASPYQAVVNAVNLTSNEEVPSNG